MTASHPRNQKIYIYIDIFLEGIEMEEEGYEKFQDQVKDVFLFIAKDAPEFDGTTIYPDSKDTAKRGSKKHIPSYPYNFTYLNRGRPGTVATKYFFAVINRMARVAEQESPNGNGKVPPAVLLHSELVDLLAFTRNSW